jgi:hypothetical protein
MRFYDVGSSATPGDTMIRCSRDGAVLTTGKVLLDGRIQHKAPDGSLLSSDKDAFIAGGSVVVRKQ